MQVHPVVSRLCAPIEGTDAARLADCLGLDPARFRGSTAAQGGADAREDALMSSGASLDDESLYKVCLMPVGFGCCVLYGTTMLGGERRRETVNDRAGVMCGHCSSVLGMSCYN